MWDSTPLVGQMLTGTDLDLWHPSENRQKETEPMTELMHGVVRGKTIELDREIGVPEGQEVEVAIRTIGTPGGQEPWGAGLRRSAGALAGIPGLDEDMDEILCERRTARFREVPE